MSIDSNDKNLFSENSLFTPVKSTQHNSCKRQLQTPPVWPAELPQRAMTKSELKPMLLKEFSSSALFFANQESASDRQPMENSLKKTLAVATST